MERWKCNQLLMSGNVAHCVVLPHYLVIRIAGWPASYSSQINWARVCDSIYTTTPSRKEVSPIRAIMPSTRYLLTGVVVVPRLRKRSENYAWVTSGQKTIHTLVTTLTYNSNYELDLPANRNMHGHRNTMSTKKEACSMPSFQVPRHNFYMVILIFTIFCTWITLTVAPLNITTTPEPLLLCDDVVVTLCCCCYW